MECLTVAYIVADRIANTVVILVEEFRCKDGTLRYIPEVITND